MTPRNVVQQMTYAEVRAPLATIEKLSETSGAEDPEAAPPTPAVFRLKEMGHALATLGMGQTPTNRKWWRSELLIPKLSRAFQRLRRRSSPDPCPITRERRNQHP